MAPCVVRHKEEEMQRLRLLIGGTLLVAGFSACAAVVEEVIEMPIELTDRHGQEVKQTMKITIFRDDAATAPQPFLVLNHGRAVTAAKNQAMGRSRYAKQSAYFVDKGFVVVLPTRIGYGETGGPDVEDKGSCANPKYAESFRITSLQVERTIELAKTLPYVDPTKGIVAGQSYGGITTIATAAKSIPGVIAAINFAGGGGGNPETKPMNPCRSDLLEAEYARFGKTAKIPTLWLYSENDQFFGTDKPREWAAAFVGQGGTAEFVQLPPYGSDGHVSFVRNPAAWQPSVERFIKTVGL